MEEKCYNCFYWKGRLIDEVELCEKHGIFMNGMRDPCSNYKMSNNSKPLIVVELGDIPKSQ